MKEPPENYQDCPWVDLQPSGGALAVEQFITARVNVVAKALNRSSSRLYLSRFGMTVPEWRILSNLTAHGACASRDLIEHISMDKALISRTVQRLQRRRLLIVRANPNDRRSTLMELTDSGAAMYRKLLPYARRRQSKIMKALTREERRVLWVALAKLERTAEEINSLEARHLSKTRN